QGDAVRAPVSGLEQVDLLGIGRVGQSGERVRGAQRHERVSLLVHVVEIRIVGGDHQVRCRAVVLVPVGRGVGALVGEGCRVVVALHRGLGGVAAGGGQVD